MSENTRVCPVCDGDYFPSHKHQTTCGTRCGREFKRRAGRGEQKVQKPRPLKRLRCKTCRREFSLPPSRPRHQMPKFCSRDCEAAAEANHEGKKTIVQAPLAKAKVSSDRRRFDSGLRMCQSVDCARTHKATQQHHVVYRQHVRRARGDEWDPTNALCICVDCHAAHHHRGKVLDSRSLTDENLAFAIALFGEFGAFEYLRRYYTTTNDPRIR